MSWHVKNSGYYYYTRDPAEGATIYDILTPEGIDNATEIHNQALGYGLTSNAVCGVLACMIRESGLNPWAWAGGTPTKAEVDYLPSNRSYGLPQWDRASATNVYQMDSSKYINNQFAVNLPNYGPNFADEIGNVLDGQCQINYLFNYCCANLSGVTWYRHYPETPYYLPYEEFKASTLDPGFLALVFTDSFERSATGTEKAIYLNRLATALFNYFGGINPPDPPTPTKRTKMPLYMMCGKPKRRIIWR